MTTSITGGGRAGSSLHPLRRFASSALETGGVIAARGWTAFPAGLWSLNSPRLTTPKAFDLPARGVVALLAATQAARGGRARLGA
jgi:hypothetical protein